MALFEINIFNQFSVTENNLVQLGRQDIFFNQMQAIANSKIIFII